MSEQEQTSQEEVAAYDTDLEDAAAQAAIAESRGQEPPESPEPEQESQQDEAASPPTVLAGMTEEQVKELLVKAGSKVDELSAQMRNMFGRYGELNSKLQQLQKTETAVQADGNAEELSRKYHEALLNGDMDEASKLFLQVRQGHSETEPQPTVDIDEKLTKQDQKVEERLLRKSHPDWAAVTRSNDFALWTQTLPEADRQTLASTWDSDFIGEKLDDFKTWKKDAEKPAQPDQQRQQRTKRLENAVTPNGAGSIAPTVVTEEEAMQAAIRARLRRRT